MKEITTLSKDKTEVRFEVIKVDVSNEKEFKKEQEKIKNEIEKLMGEIMEKIILNKNGK